ncbi:DUF3325 domain-containing protein [Thalassotalea marina]|uniref:DUF3325 domain-containing protein n=1 Tax=Thalassotalea marina TaxID=1673741 RepID=UPI0016793641|nr:DUF3325 domain-containing protein [Thalassotalea marina]
MIFLLSFLPLVFGCICLAWSMPKHHRQWFKTRHTAQRERVFTIGGWLLLLVALTICIKLMPIALGLVYFVAVLTLTVVITAFSSTYIDKSKKKLSF